MRLPVYSKRRLLDPMRRRVESMRLPVRSTRLPVESTRLPVRSTRLPVESTRLPVRSTRLPVRSTRLPVRSTRLPVEPVRLSLESLPARLLPGRPPAPSSTLLPLGLPRPRRPNVRRGLVFPRRGFRWTTHVLPRADARPERGNALLDLRESQRCFSGSVHGMSRMFSSSSTTRKSSTVALPVSSRARVG